MAIAPWFVCGPAAWLAALGHHRGPEPTVPTPAEDWQRAVVDVVIPVCRNQHTIIHCLAALLQQSRLPRRVLLVDDGGISRDHALQFAREFARANGIAPEGTRKPVERWKTGFWKIAHAARVPVLPVYFHYPDKVIGIGPAFTTSDDMEADLARLRDWYRPWQGKLHGTS